jgi:hypothetical protein
LCAHPANVRHDGRGNDEHPVHPGPKRAREIARGDKRNARLLVSGTIVVLLVAVAGVRISSQPTIFLCSYGYANPRDAGIANALTLDEARRPASNIAALPTLLGKG